MQAVASEPRKARASSLSSSVAQTIDALEYEKKSLLHQLQRLSVQQQDDKNADVLEQFGVETSQFITVFADLLEAIAENGDPMQHENNMTIFHTANPPDISMHDYLHRILKFTLCSSTSYLLAMIYLDRISQNNPCFVISSKCIHRLILTSIMMAAKFFDEKFQKNSYWSKVGGISNDELNKLEREFLTMTQYQLFVCPTVYSKYKSELFDATAGVDS